jgi:hypothetical protein
MVAVAEKLPDTNCDARIYQIGEILLNKITNLLGGKEEAAIVLASYSKSEDGTWFCRMPAKIRVGETSTDVVDYQWFEGTSWVLFELGFNIHDIMRELDKEGEIKKEEIEVGEERVKAEVQTYEKTYSLEPTKLRGDLSRIKIEDQFEVAVVARRILPIGKKAEEIVKKSEGWQILVRRKNAQ